jgi:hypothetical protein
MNLSGEGRRVAEEDANVAVSGGHGVIIHVGAGLVSAQVSCIHHISFKQNISMIQGVHKLWATLRMGQSHKTGRQMNRGDHALNGATIKVAPTICDFGFLHLHPN